MEVARMRGSVLVLVVAGAIGAVGGIWWFAPGMPESHVAAEELARATPTAVVPTEALDARAVTEEARTTLDVAAIAEANPARSAAREGSLDALEELRRARRRGVIRDDEFSAWLADAYLRHRDPEGALALLERCDSKDANMWWRAGQELAKAGDREGQERAVARGLELQPGNSVFVAGLAELDPLRAIRLLERRLSEQAPPGDPALRKALARVLEKGGRAAEAKLLLSELLEKDPRDREALQLYGKIDPGEAAARLEALMAAADDPAPWRAMLARLYLKRGDPDAVRRLIESAESAGRSIAQEEWGQLAETLIASGSKEPAVEAWTRALGLEHGDPDPWVSVLAEHAPGQIVALLEARVAGDERANDEYWGSLADAYWELGRRLDAQEAWTRARSLDPGDDEWRTRLSALAAGTDPFQ